MTDSILALCGLVEFIFRVIALVVMSVLLFPICIFLIELDGDIIELLSPKAWQVIEKGRNRK